MKQLILLLTLGFLVLFGLALFFVTRNGVPPTADDVDALNRVRALTRFEPWAALFLFAWIYVYFARQRRPDVTPGIVLAFSGVFSLFLTMVVFYCLMNWIFLGERGRYLPPEGIWSVVTSSWPVLVPLAVIMWIWNRYRTSRLLVRG